MEGQDSETDERWRTRLRAWAIGSGAYLALEVIKAAAGYEAALVTAVVVFALCVGLLFGPDKGATRGGGSEDRRRPPPSRPPTAVADRPTLVPNAPGSP